MRKSKSVRSGDNFMLDDSTLISQVNGLYKFALKLCKNKADADDLLQASILRAIEYRDRFETGTNAFSWMSRIMYNVFVTQYNRKKKFESKYDPENEIKKLSFAAQQEDELIAKQMLAQVENLSVVLRKTLLSVSVDDMSHQEASKFLGVPEGTIKSRVHRARAKLVKLTN